MYSGWLSPAPLLIWWKKLQEKNNIASDLLELSQKIILV